MPLENTAGAEQTEPQDTGDRPGIENLAELLRVDETPRNDETADAGGSHESPDGEEKATLKRFNDLAGRLNVNLDTLYKLEVSQADDGTPVTVENLKDEYSKRGAFSLREIETEERNTEREAKIMQAQTELQELMAALPPNAVKPEALQKLRAKREAVIDQEKRRTLEVIPDWKDDQTRTADIAGMVDHLKQYGYPVNHLQQVTDHRQMKYIRDNYLREKRIRSALEKVRAGNPAPTPPSTATGKAPRKNPVAGAKRGAARNQLEAIFSNLK